MQIKERVEELVNLVAPELGETKEIGIEHLYKILQIEDSLPNIARRFWNELSNSDKIQELLALLFAVLILALLAFCTLLSAASFLICTLIAIII